MDPEEVIQMMVHQFKKVFGPDLVRRASELGISEKEAVILASSLKKKLPSLKRNLLSLPFSQSLEKKYSLQSDPTVIYELRILMEI